jgi:hypothetical protein
MTTPADITCTAFKDGTLTLLARVVGQDAAPIVQADLATIAYTVYRLDRWDAEHRQAVTGHAAVELDVVDVVFNTLQADALWTADATGYNFRHTIDIGSHAAFPVAGQYFLVEYTLTPVSDQPILVRFRVKVI